MIEEINEADLKKILNTNKIVIVDFSAVWCGPCKIQQKFLEKLQEKYKNKGVKIVSIDIDKNDKFANKLNIMAVPTLQIYKNGVIIKFPENEETDRFIGPQSDEMLSRICDKLLAS